MPLNDRLVSPSPRVLVAIPGTGSDGDHIGRAFGPAATWLGVELIALEPENDLVAGYLRRLDQLSATAGRLLVGGVSIGAAIALEWALKASAEKCAGVLGALPAWCGVPSSAPAAHSALATAESLRTAGLDATVATMAASSPTWLAEELSRSWRALSGGLEAQLRAAAAYTAPEAEALTTLEVPLAITAATDDPVHPIDVARRWCSAAPRARLVEVTLTEWGEHPAILGNGCARAYAQMLTAD
ncbi:alpha/beta fold hydrolase [Gordonia sp. ABSL49_1]|uniref:alpha/beta fold hydrolase n=1 Tax=Gordonia sp. ABSL49_1 TaxID=2920941 RepID=UPI001F0F9D3F|nr:alpha/beta fold hydrolase [Gordonia sp. ABSL49_1]MCH5642525.1 alpha/beta hydrolase [Gordonia sp. ABSL49_1]